MKVMPAASRAPRRATRGEITRREILKAAVDIASMEGLEELTIGRLAQEVKMSKSGLFAHFGSKEDLQLATVDAARAIFVERVAEPAFQSPSGIVRLVAMLDEWLGYVEKSVFRGGCFFAAASAEFDDRPGPVRDQIASLTKSWLDALEEETRQAIRLGHIQPRNSPAQVAFELHAMAQEANWAFRLLNDARAFDRARTAVHWRLEIAATPAGMRLLRRIGNDRQTAKKPVSKSSKKGTPR